MTEKLSTSNEVIIQSIAQIAHEANRAYCATLGDLSQLPWSEAPQWQRDSAVKGVLHILEHPNAVPADSHESWLKEKTAEGWKYGPIKNPETKEHPCYVPYSELPADQQMKDYIFLGVAKAMISKYKQQGLLQIERPYTDGEIAMNVAFNPSQRPELDQVKQAYANLYDQLEREAVKYWSSLIESEKDFRDKPHLMKRSLTEMTEGEKRRIRSAREMSIAKTELESSQMRAIKSLTR
jgi:hypothetical protein